MIAVGSLGQLGVLAAPKFYSRQQTTAMQPVGLKAGLEGLRLGAGTVRVLGMSPPLWLPVLGCAAVTWTCS